MVWAEAIPNLLIGVREGLEAGLVVSILLAAVAQYRTHNPTDRRISAAPVWLGVAAAVSLAASFAAVLTFTTAELSTAVQEGVGGALGVLAVGLVTWMVFWMRRAAPGLSRQLRADVARAATIGAGALTLIAFLAVGREGLETTLFIWTAVKASGSTVSPLIGAAVGIALAVALCWLLYNRAIRLNLAKFFTITGVALIIIAAGILSYSLGDLQEAGWLPGNSWLAFDLTGRVDPNVWWLSLVSGITNLSVRMTVLQVTAWVAYTAVTVAAFVSSARTTPVPADTPANEAGPSRWERLLAGYMWPTAAALVLTPVAVAALIITLVPRSHSTGDIRVSVTDHDCAKEWAATSGGTRTFQVHNKSGRAGEINLVDSTGGVVAEIETLAPATTASMTVTLGAGEYAFTCRLSGRPVMSSAAVRVTAATSITAAQAILPVSLDDLAGPNAQYQNIAAAALDALADNAIALRNDLAADDLAGAKVNLLAAQMNWERVGASYNSFGDLGKAVSGLPWGLPGGVDDDDFTGLHRLEYGIYHDQDPAGLVPIADRLLADIAVVRKNLRREDLAGDPTNLPIRAHEILEDAQRDHLSGIDDLGGGFAYPATMADIDITRSLIGELTPLLDARSPKLVATINTQLDTLSATLIATQGPDGRWLAPAQVPPAQRQDVNAALGAVLETLAVVPDLLEVPPNH
ncbi:iron uptake transporter permease EfeU [Mycobacterium spongiae]|uniref:Iron permease n=1 Tax=Mycobacterium spongiae TaxID=886343 RepID=A0A975K3X2_9MYCO|nr:iron uptake transporter permease EfeU [Mycobacterium spongiae]QUR69949.1 iron permease [Mycobacterium spongiae]